MCPKLWCIPFVYGAWKSQKKAHYFWRIVAHKYFIFLDPRDARLRTLSYPHITVRSVKQLLFNAKSLYDILDKVSLYYDGHMNQNIKDIRFLLYNYLIDLSISLNISIRAEILS